MEFVTFHPYRTIGIPNVKYIKPEHTFREIDSIKNANLIFFPEKWQLPVLTHALKKTIFPNYDTIVLGHNKVDMTRALQTVCPESFPYTEIRGNTVDNQREILETFPFPFVAKNPRNSMGQGVFLIHSEHDFYAYCEQADILYIQEYLPSDREIRVVVIGEDIYSSYWKIAENNQFYHNISKGGQISYHHVPIEVLDLVKRVSSELNINHAGFDVLLIDGKPFILEFNVLFGNQGLTMAGKRVEEAIFEYVLNTYFHPKPRTPVGGKRIS